MNRLAFSFRNPFAKKKTVQHVPGWVVAVSLVMLVLLLAIAWRRIANPAPTIAPTEQMVQETMQQIEFANGVSIQIPSDWQVASVPLAAGPEAKVVFLAMTSNQVESCAAWIEAYKYPFAEIEQDPSQACPSAEYFQISVAEATAQDFQQQEALLQSAQANSQSGSPINYVEDAQGRTWIYDRTAAIGSMHTTAVVKLDSGQFYELRAKQLYDSDEKYGDLVRPILDTVQFPQ